MSTAVLRVAVCEDSRTYAHALTRVLQSDGLLRVIGTFGSGEELLAALPSLDVDLVTMDLELPGMNGVMAIESIMAGRPLPIVVLSSHTARGGRLVAAALAAGAVDVFHKGDLSVADADSPSGQELRRRMRAFSGVRVRPPANGSPVASAPPSRVAGLPRTAGFRAVGIAASTGGPAALRTLIGALPAVPTIAFVVVQHMSPGFTEGLVAWLDDAVAAPVRLAQDATVAAPGIWVAPDGAHLLIDGALRFRLDTTAPTGLHRPSADVLFASMARGLGAAALAVVLTGMGRDGARGVEDVLLAGGVAIAQDEADAVLPSMPHAAAGAGAIPAGSPAEIGAMLSALRGGDRR